MNKYIMIKHIHILIFCVSLLGSITACNPIRTKEIKYKIGTDTLTDIPVFDKYSFFEENNRIYFCIKPLKCDSLILYTTDGYGKWQLESHLRIPEDYADNKDMDKVDEWVFINRDTVISVESNRQAVFLDMRHNRIIRTVPFITDSYDLDTRCFANIQWNRQRHVLPLMYISYDTTGRKYNADVEMIADYSLEKGLVPVPVRYPRVLTEGKLAAYLNYFNPLVVSHDNVTVYAFTTSPKMLYYDHQKNKLKKRMVKNPNYCALPTIDTTGLSMLSLPNFIMQQYLLNSFYEYLLYDPNKKMYYRFFSKEMPLKNEEGLFNTLDDKEYGVSLLDCRLKVVGDVCFRPSDFKRDYHVTQKGLCRATQQNGTTLINFITFYED